jgi:hypothetical protein
MLIDEFHSLKGKIIDLLPGKLLLKSQHSIASGGINISYICLLHKVVQSEIKWGGGQIQVIQFIDKLSFNSLHFLHMRVLCSS